AVADRLAWLAAPRVASADAYLEDALKVTPDVQRRLLVDPRLDAAEASWRVSRARVAARSAEPDASAMAHQVSSVVHARFGVSASVAQRGRVLPPSAESIQPTEQRAR